MLLVLIVDDVEINRQVFARHLGSWGMGVATASNAGEALSELERAVRQGRPYDLVLLEEDLPGMSGHDIGVRIRANPAFRGTRIIITAKDRKSTRLNSSH